MHPLYALRTLVARLGTFVLDAAYLMVRR